MDCFESPHNCSWETVTRDLKGPAAKLKSYPECNMRLQCCLWPESLSRSRISQEISHDREVSLFYGTRQDKMSSRVVTLEQKTPLCYEEAADVYSCACSALISWVICVRDNQKVRTHQDAHLRPHILRTDAISRTTEATRKETSQYRVRCIPWTCFSLCTIY